jgi:16S rRNA (cytosine967-C5)-methyltransferase
MHPNALIDHTAQLLGEVLRFDSPTDGLLSQHFRKNRGLGPRERHAIAETVYGVLRKRMLFQHLATSGHGSVYRRLALLAWQGDTGFLRAAMTEPERTWLAQVQVIDVATLPEKCRHNLPDWLATLLQQQMPAEDFWPLMDALNQPAGMDLRTNVLKSKREALQAAFAAEGVEVAVTPYSPWGLRAKGKPALHKNARFLAGECEVQDEGSQLLALAVDAKRGEMVVDFCAGAGGKTLALGAAMRNTGRLYAFDTSGHRLDALKPRLARSGLSNVHPAQLAHERDERIKRLAGKIDRVLVDAPCSGLGTLRRNPDLKWRQSLQGVAEMVAKQTAILESAARLLKPGGRLVYATCSVLQAENEGVADAFTAAQLNKFQPLLMAQALTAAQVEQAETLVHGDYLRLRPQHHGTDAFFAAAWQRV